MRCRECGAPTRVVDSRPASLEPKEGTSAVLPLKTIWRLRACTRCSCRVKTIETPVGPALGRRLTVSWRKKGATS